MADDDATDSNGNPICKVYDKNDFFTLAVQMFLAFVALASLWWKRQSEFPRRTLKTWFLDISKQAMGACYAHVLNMMVAAIISHNIRGDTVLEDQCAWYGLSYLIDTTLGLVLAILLVQLLDQQANKHDWTYLKNSGVYHGDSAYGHWAAQVTAWMVILSVVKLVIYLIMWLGSDALAFIGGLLFAPLQGNIRFELVFVMILFPGVLNIIYFWIADSYLKAKDSHTAAHEPTSDKQIALMASAGSGGAEATADPAAASTAVVPNAPLV